MLPINTSRAVVKSTLVARDERGVNKTNGKVSKQNLDCLHSYDFVQVPEFPRRQRFRRLGRGRGNLHVQRERADPWTARTAERSSHA